jgi:hypothetical protein
MSAATKEIGLRARLGIALWPPTSYDSGMPKRSRPEGPNGAAYRVVQQSTRDRATPTLRPRPKAKRKNHAGVALGRKGGLPRDRVRAERPTPEERISRWRSEP